MKNSKKEESNKIFPFRPNGEFYFQRGIEAFRNQEMPEALRYLERAAFFEPDEPVIMCQLAICYTELGQFDKSNQILRRILDEADDINYCYYFMANNYAYMKDFKSALQHANKYLARISEGEYVEEAKDLIQLIMEEAPLASFGVSDMSDLEKEFFTFKEKVDAYISDDKLDELSQFLVSEIEEKPTFWQAYLELAGIRFKEERFAEGLAILEDVLARDPGNLMALCELYLYAYYQAKQEQTEQILAELGNVEPFMSFQREKLARIYAMAGNYKRADQLFAKVSQLDIMDRYAYYYYRAQTAFFLGRVEEAENFWQQFNQIDGEELNFPWDEPDLLANDESAVLQKMASSDKAEHLFGIYLLTVSDKQPALIMFNDYFDMTGWDFFEHLIFSEFEFLPDSLDAANCNAVVAILGRMEELGFPAKIETTPMYQFALNFMKESIDRKYDLRTKNLEAVAAAILYRYKFGTQKVIADLFGISVASLRKYSLEIEGF
ncbi:TPR domain-containing protein [Listeria weihenstephanensis FSL R9-0317]|uniref:Tetratricopeptide repeat protein n=1 Tax=Listeria weihenstephanensis TaxID=1006155 RepID=A0A841Z544_9LIST|nr:tetratricopeptide repeat protein [Listeria weihenstephanensis]EUJ40439.1 TPR domain-containing protein [Listeria weihenstephanensis FSL R9-0317]MBC1500385.1 tetratricopeptide repeat protein [Listeria weihenstephanensis]